MTPTKWGWLCSDLRMCRNLLRRGRVAQSREPSATHSVVSPAPPTDFRGRPVHIAAHRRRENLPGRLHRTSPDPSAIRYPTHAKDTTGIVEAIRQLSVARDGAVKARSAALCQLGDLLVTAPAALREQLNVRKTLEGKPPSVPGYDPAPTWPIPPRQPKPPSAALLVVSRQ